MVKRTYQVLLLAVVVFLSGCLTGGGDKAAIEQNITAMQAAASTADVEAILSNSISAALYVTHNDQELLSVVTRFSKNNLFDFLSSAENIGVETHELWQNIAESGLIEINGSLGTAVSNWSSRMALTINGTRYEQEFSASVITRWQKHNNVWLFTGIEIRIDGWTETA